MSGGSTTNLAAESYAFIFVTVAVKSDEPDETTSFSTNAIRHRRAEGRLRNQRQVQCLRDPPSRSSTVIDWSGPCDQVPTKSWVVLHLGLVARCDVNAPQDGLGAPESHRLVGAR